MKTKHDRHEETAISKALGYFGVLLYVALMIYALTFHHFHY